MGAGGQGQSLAIVTCLVKGCLSNRSCTGVSVCSTGTGVSLGEHRVCSGRRCHSEVRDHQVLLHG